MNPWSHVRDRSRAGDISFHFTLQPLVFLRLLTWGMSCPLCIRLSCAQAMQFPPQQKPRKPLPLRSAMSEL